MDIQHFFIFCRLWEGLHDRWRSAPNAAPQASGSAGTEPQELEGEEGEEGLEEGGKGCPRLAANSGRSDAAGCSSEHWARCCVEEILDMRLRVRGKGEPSGGAQEGLEGLEEEEDEEAEREGNDEVEEEGEGDESGTSGGGQHVRRKRSREEAAAVPLSESDCCLEFKVVWRAVPRCAESLGQRMAQGEAGGLHS